MYTRKKMYTIKPHSLLISKNQRAINTQLTCCHQGNKPNSLVHVHQGQFKARIWMVVYFDK